MSADPCSPHASAREIAAAVRSRVVSATQVTAAALSRVERTHGRLNAFTTVTAERARREAAAVDEALAVGRDLGPLAGVPYAVKDLFDLAGTVTFAGSKILRENPPAAHDATAVTRLRVAGAVCLGAVNMGEFAYDFVTENAHAGATRNPRDLSRSAGGSSGGSAAAVAAGLVPFSLGTDTNGSIRVPSSFCGLWGLKPTYGRLSRAGTFPFVSSLDHIGPFARGVADLALAYDVMQGADPLDPACSVRPVELAGPVLGAGMAGLRVGVLGGYFAQGGDPAAHAAVNTVASALRASRRVELPEVASARAAAFVISASEGGRLHLERLRTRAADFDPACRDRLLSGAMLPASWYVQAQKFRAWWRGQVHAVFRDFDVLLAPATPVPATRLGQETMTLDGRELPVRPNLGLFTQPISFIGLPVVAAPIQRAAGALPLAVQLIGAPWAEATLLRVARHLELAGCCSAPAAPLD
ncbi:MAG: AtzE family amidohydrolase [Verrucomicrobia bacterium]|nr:AtzE family amidohydrolase [Verrucomicrobiota bacterium]